MPPGRLPPQQIRPPVQFVVRREYENYRERHRHRRGRSSGEIQAPRTFRRRPAREDIRQRAEDAGSRADHVTRRVCEFPLAEDEVGG